MVLLFQDKLASPSSLAPQLELEYNSSYSISATGSLACDVQTIARPVSMARRKWSSGGIKSSGYGAGECTSLTIDATYGRKEQLISQERADLRKLKG